MFINSIRFFLFNLTLIVALLIVTSCAKAPNSRNPVGRQYRAFVDTERTNWLTKESRPLATTVWYPASLNSVENEWNIGVFHAGWSSVNANISDKQRTFPLVVLSHGTGGSALQLSWLAEILASNGYIVAAVNHHGNTAAEESYLPQGFMLWWERARDLSITIEKLLSDSTFSSRIDRSRIGAAGFSLGGYTVLELAGARTSLAQWESFCVKRPANPDCILPPEAGFSLNELKILKKNNAIVKASLEMSGDSYRDKRIRAIYSIAPVQGPALTKDSLAQISIPVRIIVGTKDKQAIPEFNAKPIASSIPKSELRLIKDVSHYTFLANCSLKGKLFVSQLCSDPSGINRDKIHNEVGADALHFFNRTLLNVASSANK